MQSSSKHLSSTFANGSQFRDGESNLGASFAVNVAYEDASVEKDTVGVASVARRLAHTEVTSLVTVALLYGIAIVSVWLLSLVVRVHPDQFPAGALTSLQLTALTLCFFSIELHLSNSVYTWLRCSRETAATIRAASEVGVYLLLFFVCDRTTLLQRRPRAFNADFFSFVAFAFVCAALGTGRHIRLLSSAHPDGDHGRVDLPPASPVGIESATSPALLTRHHVQEWVGWMQLLYVMYGYFHNVEIYRLMRVCVSSFTFLTAFTTYARYDDYSCGSTDRVLTLSQSVVLLLRSLWKLNFLVMATCALLRDQYMLYHICAVQTFVTVAVFLLMVVGPPPRSSPRVFGAKVAVAAVLGCALWDTPYSPAVFRHFWSPVQWLVRYDNPIVGVDPLHEWHFRSGLDHWIWLVGVLLANRASFLSGLLRRLDSQRPAGTAVKAVTAAGAACVVVTYTYFVEKTDTVDYNYYLPYISWAPILSFVTLRCVFQTVRNCYMPLCTFLGTFAVEAYIAHNHVFMATTGPNGGPLYTFRLLPGDHPLCDFGVFMLLLVWVSHRLAVALPRLRKFVLPHNATFLTLVENAAIMAVVVLCTYSLNYVWYSGSVKATTF